MKIQINGKSSEIRSGTVDELLRELNLLPSQVAIEHNGTVLFRHELTQVTLKQDDKLELIRVVAGG